MGVNFLALKVYYDFIAICILARQRAFVRAFCFFTFLRDHVAK